MYNWKTIQKCHNNTIDDTQLKMKALIKILKRYLWFWLIELIIHALFKLSINLLKY